MFSHQRLQGVRFSDNEESFSFTKVSTAGLFNPELIVKPVGLVNIFRADLGRAVENNFGLDCRPMEVDLVCYL